MQGFIGVMFPVFPGYPGGTGGPADFTTSRTIIKTPNVLTSARQQFACPSLEGAPFEDDGGSGTAGAHWEERIFQVRCQPHTHSSRSSRSSRSQAVLDRWT